MSRHDVDPDELYDRWRADVDEGIRRAPVRALIKIDEPSTAPAEPAPEPAEPPRERTNLGTDPHMQRLRADARLGLFGTTRRR